MRTLFASLAVFGIAAAGAAAQAQGVKAPLSFEVRGEAVRPAELSQGAAPNSALGQAHHGYVYSNCYNYYRWSFSRRHGWQRYYVGTRCY